MVHTVSYRRETILLLKVSLMWFHLGRKSPLKTEISNLLVNIKNTAISFGGRGHIFAARTFTFKHQVMMNY
jgi:hypothetical protein